MDKKIKILHFPIKNTKGGITRSALKFWKHIDHERFQFGFATCSSKLDFEREITEQGCKIHYISCYAEQNPQQFCEEFKEILRQGYDILHLNTNWWKSFYAEQAAVEVGIKKIILHARSTFIDINEREHREKETLVHEECKKIFKQEYATHFLACSTEAADFLFGSQVSREKIIIFHNALDISRYSYNEEKRVEMRNNLGLNDKFVIGNVGRMSYAKNQLFLIDCFYDIQKIVEKSVLLFLGTGELENELHRQVNKYHIEDKVIFAGRADNIEYYLQGMDVFALPSRFEGLPNVLVEAQTAGLKCISSNLVTKEVKITNNVLFVELSREKWVDAIIKYSKGYERKDTSEQIRNAGYDIKHEIKVLEKIYEE